MSRRSYFPSVLRSSTESLESLSDDSSSTTSQNSLPPGTPSKEYPRPHSLRPPPIPFPSLSLSPPPPLLPSPSSSHHLHARPLSLSLKFRGITLPSFFRGHQIPRPRYLRKRTTALALLSLLILSTYTIFFSYRSQAQVLTRHHNPASSTRFLDLHRHASQSQTQSDRIKLPSPGSNVNVNHNLGLGLDSNLDLNSDSNLNRDRDATNDDDDDDNDLTSSLFTPSHQLASLTSFLLSLHSQRTVLPPPPSNTDPSTYTLDPSSVLPFDLSRLSISEARLELERVKEECWITWPIVIFGDRVRKRVGTEGVEMLLRGLLRSSLGLGSGLGGKRVEEVKEVERVVSTVDLGRRQDGEIVKGILGRIVRETTFTDKNSDTGHVDEEGEMELELPLLFVAGTYVPQKDIPEMVNNGRLEKMLKEAVDMAAAAAV